MVQTLEGLLPERWSVSMSGTSAKGHPDAMLEITAPDGTRARLLVEAKHRVGGALAADLAERLVAAASEIGVEGMLVATGYVTPTARDRLREAGVSYLDRTGNLWLTMERPAVLMDRQGADQDPKPPKRDVQSLKGPKAARLVRALCDSQAPTGVRELARRAGTDAGYATRILKLLQEEGVVRRNGRGRVADVDWQDLLRRWTQDYSVLRSNGSTTWLAPRGVPWLRDRLETFSGRYAVTGVAAVPREVQVTAAPLLTCYVDSAESSAAELELHTAEAGANVILLEPFDDVVYERTRVVHGFIAVALSQCAADLLTGTGREPAQGETLMNWMAEHENVWRA
ncbi:MAG: helix-turn-helix domain-containing protein [Gemmatimonadota bacterium]